MKRSSEHERTAGAGPGGGVGDGGVGGDGGGLGDFLIG